MTPVEHEQQVRLKSMERDALARVGLQDENH